MTDDHDDKGPLQQAVDLFVRMPVGFVLGLPRTVPRYLARGRDALTHPADSLDQLQTHAHRTLRALGIGTTSDEARGPLPDEPDPVDPGAEADCADDDHAEARVDGAPSAPTTPPPVPIGAKGSPVVAGATVVGGIAQRVPAAVVHPPKPEAVAGVAPDGLAIPGYDSLSASQVVPRLESLSADELSQVRQYELANRGRKTILSKIAQLQA